jgi:hypothetical protein
MEVDYVEKFHINICLPFTDLYPSPEGYINTYIDTCYATLYKYLGVHFNKEINIWTENRFFCKSIPDPLSHI